MTGVLPMPVFGEDQKKKEGGAVPVVNEIVGRVNDNTKRLRLLEQREKLLTSRISSMDESFASRIDGIDNSHKDMTRKLADLESKVTTINNTLKEALKQLQFTAKKSELMKVEETIKILESALPALTGEESSVK